MRLQDSKYFLPAIYLFTVLYLFAAYGLPFLKYHNIIDWSWWWISLPWWGGMIAAVIFFLVATRTNRYVSDALVTIAFKSYRVGYTIRGGHPNPFGNPSGEIKTDAFHCISNKDGDCVFKWRDIESLGLVNLCILIGVGKL